MARLMGIRLAPDIYAGQEGYQGDNIFFHNSIYYCNESLIMRIFYTIFPMPTL